MKHTGWKEGPPKLDFVFCCWKQHKYCYFGLWALKKLSPFLLDTETSSKTFLNFLLFNMFEPHSRKCICNQEGLWWWWEGIFFFFSAWYRRFCQWDFPTAIMVSAILSTQEYLHGEMDWTGSFSQEVPQPLLLSQKILKAESSIFLCLFNACSKNPPNPFPIRIHI